METKMRTRKMRTLNCLIQLTAAILKIIAVASVRRQEQGFIPWGAGVFFFSFIIQ